MWVKNCLSRNILLHGAILVYSDINIIISLIYSSFFYILVISYLYHWKQVLCHAVNHFWENLLVRLTEKYILSTNIHNSVYT